MMLDDGSTDETERIGREYAARDRRIWFERQAVRHGMIYTWRRVFELAARTGGLDYFAWATDHDRWDRGWLAVLVDDLDRHPAAVLSYPVSRRIDAAGHFIEKPPRAFETSGMTDVRARWARLCREGIGAGDMVYGLMRADALAAAGVFRDVLRPDRLLVAELALRGEFRQVPEVRWFRRQLGIASVDRQRRTLFGAHPAPPAVLLPAALQHARVLYGNYVKRRDPSVNLPRPALAGMILRYTVAYTIRHLRKSAFRYRLGLLVDAAYRVKKAVKRAYHHSIYHAAVFTRRIGLRQ
jgi:hypothetical protein